MLSLLKNCYLKKNDVYVSWHKSLFYLSVTWALSIDPYNMLSKHNGHSSALCKVPLSVRQFYTFLTALSECMVAVRAMNQCHSLRIHPSYCTLQQVHLSETQRECFGSITKYSFNPWFKFWSEAWLVYTFLWPTWLIVWIMAISISFITLAEGTENYSISEEDTL